MLHDPERHERLTETPWSEEHARDRIRAIVRDAEKAFAPDALWPADEWDGWMAALPLKNLYVGAAGVLWALDGLQRRGFETRLDLPDAATRALERWRAEPDFLRHESAPLPSTPESALFLGEGGILLVAWRLTRHPAFADDLHARVVANVDNEADELFWGAPGTLLAAGTMWDETGDERWSDAWGATADALLGRRDEDGLWTIRLYGREARGLNVPHGAPGNVQALLAGGPLLAPDVRERLRRDTAALLERTAIREDGLATWPHPYGRTEQTDVQWCSGSPGIVVHADYLDEELLLAGAELAWHAGPPGPEKGSGICHGTAGLGYAFLKTFERTHDERWLERARRFAMHALEQVERRGHGRYSLFTGDVGVALYVADCLDARAEFPILDSFVNTRSG